MFCYFQDQCYNPIPPCGDDDALAKKARVILYHKLSDEPSMFWAPAGQVVAGWVIGVEP